MKPEPKLPSKIKGNRVPFGPIKGVEYVTPHCLVRFSQRAKVKGTAGRVLVTLEGWLTKAREAQLVPGAEVKKLLNHNVVPATYYRVGSAIPTKADWILVVVGNTLVTVHQNQSGEWIPKP